MEASKSGTRLVTRWRVLLAHEARAATCDGLYGALEEALGDVEVIDVSSMEAARAVLLAARSGSAVSRVDACFVCLDLPPAPVGGVRLGSEIASHQAQGGGLPLVLVTRSQRWLPAHATELHRVPWIPPDASPARVAEAIGAALGPGGRAPSESESESDVEPDWELAQGRSR